MHLTFAQNEFFRSATVITKIGMSMYVTGFEYGVQQIHRSESRRGKKTKSVTMFGRYGYWVYRYIEFVCIL